MSVKDQLEQFHVDGSHTTVKTKRSSAQSVVSSFSKEAAWQQQQYGEYAGGELRCAMVNNGGDCEVYIVWLALLVLLTLTI